MPKCYVREKDENGKWVNTPFDTYEEASEYVDRKYCKWEWEERQKKKERKESKQSKLQDVTFNK